MLQSDCVASNAPPVPHSLVRVRHVLPQILLGHVCSHLCFDFHKNLGIITIVVVIKLVSLGLPKILRGEETNNKRSSCLIKEAISY